jgi:hypothetical protein
MEREDGGEEEGPTASVSGAEEERPARPDGSVGRGSSVGRARARREEGDEGPRAPCGSESGRGNREKAVEPWWAGLAG